MRTSKHIITIAMVILLSIVSAALLQAAPIKMSTGFYYPTERTWTGNNGGSTGDPKQPWNDGSPGGRIYGFIDPAAPSALGKNHVGMDIRASYNSPVYAITSGTIERYYSSGDSRYWCIIVKHRLANGSSFWAVYGHCRIKSGYSTGRSVAGGEVIGYINENVNQHIHFGIKINNDFSKGWGHLALSTDPTGYGWRPPRTWMLSNTPEGATGGDDSGSSGGDDGDDNGGGGTTPPDTTPPTISITGPAVSTLFNTEQHINWSVTDSGSGVKTVTMQWEGYGPTSVSASGTMEIPLGKRTVTITATDSAGNSAMSTAGPFWVHSVVLTVGSGVFSDAFYVQQHDRAHGITLPPTAAGGVTLAEGDKVYLPGNTVVTSSGARVLQSGVVERLGRADPQPTPIFVTTAAIANPGLSNHGLLIKTLGRVTYVDPNGKFFYIDDGSGIFDGIQTGIRVRCDGFANGSTLSAPALGKFVNVTGISATATVSGQTIKVVRPRRQSDIVAL